MRIDYNEPKKSYTSPQPSSGRSRKESSNPILLAVVITGVVSLAIGFGSGWLLSQRHVKKGFQAAMEQQSLENAPKVAVSQPADPKQPPPTPQPVAEPTQSQSGATAPGPQPAPDAPLSFYKTLPSGQKNNILGSGINVIDNKVAKQPLQAAMPSNLAKPLQPQPSANTNKAAVATPAEKPSPSQESDRFTVQIASYSLKSEADTMKNKLASKGYSAYISESNQGDKGIWFRVRVGKKLDQDAAKELASKLGKGAIPIPD